eukprot:5068693-Alexandrium_andersonii.AAC.1
MNIKHLPLETASTLVEPHEQPPRPSAKPAIPPMSVHYSKARNLRTSNDVAPTARPSNCANSASDAPARP